MPRPKKETPPETAEEQARRRGMTVIRAAQPGPPMPVLPPTGLAGAMRVPIERVVPDPDQPRRDWATDDAESRLRELAGSIREFGILQPLIVREGDLGPDGAQRFVIIAGGRRRAAAELAGLTHLPVFVRDEEGARIRVLQLIENLQRQDLNPIDEANAFQELMEIERLSPVQLAGWLHISEQTVRDRLGLLKDVVLADAVRRRQVAASVIRDLQKLPSDVVRDFRARIERGERVQGNDVLAARLELEAAGRVNPLRMGGRRKRTDAAPPAARTPYPGRDEADGGATSDPPAAAVGAKVTPEHHDAAPAAPQPAPPSRPTEAPPTHHIAATAAWGRRLGEFWWRWLREQDPAVAEQLATAMWEGGEGGDVPDWWGAIYLDLRARLAPVQD